MRRRYPIETVPSNSRTNKVLGDGVRMWTFLPARHRASRDSKETFFENFLLTFSRIFAHSLQSLIITWKIIFKKLKVQKSQRGEMTFRVVNEPNGLKMTSSFTINSAQNINQKKKVFPKNDYFWLIVLIWVAV